MGKIKKTSAGNVVNVASKFDVTSKFETLTSKMNSMLAIQNKFSPPAIIATMASANKVAQLFTSPVAEAVLSGITTSGSLSPSSYQNLNVCATLSDSVVNKIDPLTVTMKGTAIGSISSDNWEIEGLYTTVMNPLNRVMDELNCSLDSLKCGVADSISPQVNGWQTNGAYFTAMPHANQLMTEVTTSLSAITMTGSSLNEFLSPINDWQTKGAYISAMPHVDQLMTEVTASLGSLAVVGTPLNEFLSPINDWQTKGAYISAMPHVDQLMTEVTASLGSLVAAGTSLNEFSSPISDRQSKGLYTTIIEPINKLIMDINNPAIVTLKDAIIGENSFMRMNDVYKHNIESYASGYYQINNLTKDYNHPLTLALKENTLFNSSNNSINFYVTASDNKYNLAVNFNVFADNRLSNDLYATINTFSGLTTGNFNQIIEGVGITSILSASDKWGVDSIGIGNSNSNYWIQDAENKEIDISMIESVVTKTVKKLRYPSNAQRVDVTCSKTNSKVEIHIHYHFHGDVTGNGNQFGNIINY